MADEIITELWKIKDAIANEHGCNVRALVAHLTSNTEARDQDAVDLRSVKQTADKEAHVDAKEGESI